MPFSTIESPCPIAPKGAWCNPAAKLPSIPQRCGARIGLEPVGELAIELCCNGPLGGQCKLRPQRQESGILRQQRGSVRKEGRRWHSLEYGDDAEIVDPIVRPCSARRPNNYSTGQYLTCVEAC